MNFKDVCPESGTKNTNIMKITPHAKMLAIDFNYKREMVMYLQHGVMKIYFLIKFY
ncbi:hypothetical protein [Pantoea sp. Aalb]|uniref:hypothetical protein n=1 Tax=Pantoea sp. Aalb TaxID=2576762 RepID=UPI00135B72B6|nr:hypothetical protein [Pantoea sp. Aalb]